MCAISSVTSYFWIITILHPSIHIHIIHTSNEFLHLLILLHDIFLTFSCLCCILLTNHTRDACTCYEWGHLYLILLHPLFAIKPQNIYIWAWLIYISLFHEFLFIHYLKKKVPLHVESFVFKFWTLLLLFFKDFSSSHWCVVFFSFLFVSSLPSLLVGCLLIFPRSIPTISEALRSWWPPRPMEPLLTP